MLGNLAGFDPKKDLLKPEELLPLDQWALSVAIEKLNVFALNKQNDLHLACGALQAFLSDEMSSFYFSIIKDRLYTMPEKSIGRRSAQTTLFYMLEILVRSISPILSFTAEEIWQEMKKMFDDRQDTVFTARWDNWFKLTDTIAENVKGFRWQNIINVRAYVNKELEQLRAAGVIGSSLEAEVTLYCNKENYELLNRLGDELRFILITSEATVKLDETTELRIEVKKTAHQKCCRCWHYRKDVGSNSAHPELCGRCVGNVE